MELSEALKKESPDRLLKRDMMKDENKNRDEYKSNKGNRPKDRNFGGKGKDLKNRGKDMDRDDRDKGEMPKEKMPKEKMNGQTKGAETKGRSLKGHYKGKEMHPNDYGANGKDMYRSDYGGTYKHRNRALDMHDMLPTDEPIYEPTNPAHTAAHIVDPFWKLLELFREKW